MRGENVGTLGCDRRVVGRNRVRAWPALLLLTVAFWLPSPAAAVPVHTEFFIEDGGSGSTACINVVSLRYYLCVRADGTSYRIYY